MRLLPLCVICTLLLPVFQSSADEGLSVGYGVADLNVDKHLGRVQGSEYYDFFQFTFLYEKPLQSFKHFSLFAEPFAAYVNRPNDGLDGGLYVGLKVYPMNEERKGLFIIAGTGAAYTTIKFREQGAHQLFTLEAGIGYRIGRFFVQDVLRHYSNAGLYKPNRSVQANILSTGFYF